MVAAVFNKPNHLETAKATMNRLNIKLSAYETLGELTFLYDKGMNQKAFDGLENTPQRQIIILSVMSEERKKMMDQNRYSNFSEFEADYQKDPKASLERLFVERFNEGKMRRFEEHVGDNIEKMYSLHSLNPYARAMRILELM